MVFRLSTLSTLGNDGVDYKTGDLSLYPEVLDDQKSLYVVANNAETMLRQSLSYNAKYVIVENASAFPPYGILRIGPKSGSTGTFELIYYDSRNDTTFMNLVRGFAGSVQSAWPSGVTYVGNSVCAEIHNAAKDAVLKIEEKVGLEEFPDPESLNGILKSLESKHLAPKPLFRCFPTAGAPPLSVRFQNFSNLESIRFLWDFGDGTTSAEKSPVHTYQNEGVYSVRLNMIMSTGAQGIAIKNDYITVSEKEIVPFFYATLASMSNDAPATYEFVDQTDGDIAARYWVFDDGENLQVNNPNVHTATHTYVTAGRYVPSLLIVFKDQSLQRVFLQNGITIT